MSGNFSSLVRQSIAILALWLAFTFHAAAQSSQWIAFNDHFSGPNTGPNTTSWNVFTNQFGAPGNSGFLKDSVTGVQLPVTMTITNLTNGVSQSGTTSSGPFEGTPAAMMFTNQIDFGNGGAPFHAIQLAGASKVDHTFSGLDPSARYSWHGTAVRGGNYNLRWTLMEISAASYENAHTLMATGVFVQAQIPTLSVAQAVFNSGENRAPGVVVGWTNIAPNPDGTIHIYQSTYRGAFPSGSGFASDAGNYGYAIVADRLEAFTVGPPFAPTNQALNLPLNTNTHACGNITLASLFTGSPTPTYRWYKDGAPMDTVANPSAASPTLVLNNIQTTSAGSYQVHVSNASGSAVSRTATVGVTVDSPHIASVTAMSSNANSFLFTFDVPVNAANLDVFSISFVSRNGVAPGLGQTATASVQLTPTTVVVSSELPRDPGVNYIANIVSDAAVVDTCGGAALVPTNLNVLTEVALSDYDNATDMWSYNQSGADLGTAWSEMNYDDSTWSVGPAFFGLETAANVLGPIRTPWTIGAAQLTYYLRKSVNVPAPSSQILSLTLHQQVDDGSVTYINGIEVDRHGLGTGVITNASLAANEAEPQALLTTSIGVTNVVQGRNVVAVEVHQTSTTSSDVLYGSKLLAVCKTIYPSLTLSRLGNNLTVSWPEYGVNGRLQTSTDLVSWLTDGRVPASSMGSYSLSYTIPAGGGKLFIRLQP